MHPKKFFLVVALSLSFIGTTSTSTKAQSLSDLDGNAFLMHPRTGQFLGNVSSDRFDDQSICNPYGTYGSKYQEMSLWNKYGDYGSPYSNVSAYNSRAQYPPILYLKNGQALAVVSVSSKWEPVIHPGALLGVICGQR
ncbi:hypothetical protein [Nostoc sp. FACHB-190]|uniref:hypothetical protein n=1 Tax=Nostoc sp. FACHB-190 TaxID=2692838 RepID=UPI0016884231|nr:hypothetical protein [Nostoc sp. FACHB-190]MBD2299879.1 hypothetical protein [Nostoc sp. FACHB-190]